MKDIIILVALGLLTMIGAVVEVFFQNLPSSVVQLNGLCTILFALLFVLCTLRLQSNGIGSSGMKNTA